MLLQSILPRYRLSSSHVDVLAILIQIYQYSLSSSYLHWFLSLPQAHASIPTWWLLCCNANSKVLNQGRKPPKKRFIEMKSTVTDRNVTNSEERQFTNQVTSLMSDVESILSTICVKMSSISTESRKKVLPCVSKILYQVETIVSSSSQPQHTITDLW